MHSLIELLVVEDELIIAEHIVRILKNEGYRNIRVAKSVSVALGLIAEKKPDMVLTDIGLGEEKTGIDLGKILNEEYRIPFIYITSHSSLNLVRQASQTRPNAYLVKPFKKEDLIVALEIAILNSVQKQVQLDSDCLLLKEGTITIQIPFNDIILLKAEENYTAINTTTQRPRFVRYFLGDIQKKMPEDQFVRIHRSYIINRKFISEIHASHLVICNFQLPIGRAYRAGVDNFVAKK